MKKYLFILICLCCSFLNSLKGETKIANITIAGIYSFSNPSIWLPSGVPVAGDIAIINISLTLNTNSLTVTLNNGLNLNNATSKGSLIINDYTNSSTNPLFPNVSVTTIINGLITAGNISQDGIMVTNYGTASNILYFNNAISTSNMTVTSTINSGRTNLRIAANSIINNLTINNLTTTLNQNVLVSGAINSGGLSTNAHIQILGNLILQSPGGNISEFANSFQTSIYGNVILGSGNIGEGHCRIGKSILNNNIDQTYNLFGDLILNPGAQIYCGFTIFNFNKAGVQKITNNTDIVEIQPEFEKINIGTTNATTLIFDTLSTNPCAYLSSQLATVGIIIGENSTLDLPRDYSTGTDFSLNILPSSSAISNITMRANSRLRIGGSKTEAASMAPGVFGSNFPFIRDNDPNSALRGSYILDPISTIEYYGDCTILQTIHSGVPYTILVVSNPNGSGCKAIKTISNSTTSAKRFDVETNTVVNVSNNLNINN
jgi:hypothetical protein